MKRSLLVVLVVLAVAVCLPSTAGAQPSQSANFTGDCVTATLTCTFNASSSVCSAGAFPTDYFWTFANPSGGGSGVTINRTFSNSNNANVTLQLNCSDGRDANKTRTVCWGGGSNCILPDVGPN